jgi:L-fucose isomerase-like protein
MRNTQVRFAVMFGNRGFFPEHLIALAREEMRRVIESAGYEAVMMNPDVTRFGVVNSAEEGRVFASFLAGLPEPVDGIIITLPNFGNENGAATACQEAGVLILIQAYPDESGSMDFTHRRDAFCGKFSIMDVLYQYRIPFTTNSPHVIHPDDPRFLKQLHHFAGVCRIVRAMRRCTVGAIGARTSVFKTVRFDELTLQKYGITTETVDLSEVIDRVKKYIPTLRSSVRRSPVSGHIQTAAMFLRRKWKHWQLLDVFLIT